MQHRNSHQRDHDQHGFSLVELLIAMTLGLILISGVIVVFVGSKRSSDIASAMSDLQENGRFALNAMASDVRMAGYQGCLDVNAGAVTVIAKDPPTADLRKTAVSGSIVQSDNSWLPALSLGSGSNAFQAPTANPAVPGTHTLAVQFARGNGRKPTGPLQVGGANDASGPITVPDDMGLEVDDLAIIANCEGGELFRVSGVSTGSGVTSIAHAASKNLRGNFDQIYGTTATLEQTQLMPFKTHVYFIGTTGRSNASGDAVRALYVQSMPFDATNNPPVELIEGVEDMRVSFGIGDIRRACHLRRRIADQHCTRAHPERSHRAVDGLLGRGQRTEGHHDLSARRRHGVVSDDCRRCEHLPERPPSATGLQHDGEGPQPEGEQLSLGKHSVRHVQNSRKQRGAALMVALIIIFMMSILGISALRGASLEYQMAVNSIQAQEVLQAAESSNEAALNNDALLTDAFEAAQNDEPDEQYLKIETEIRDDIGMVSSVTLRYVGDGNAVGASMDASQGANSFDALRFRAEGTARIASVNASRTVHQGASRNVPR